MARRDKVFIDTSAFIAIRVADEKEHANALKSLQKIKSEKMLLYTTNFILDEVYTFFSRQNHVALEQLDLIMNNPIINYHRIAVEDEKQTVKILKKFVDKGFSYTDATSFAFMERLGISTAFAYDNHFKQYGKFDIL